MEINVTTRLAKRKVTMMVRDLPLMLSGKKKDVYGVRHAFWSGFAMSMYIDISKAYYAKMTKRRDELGDSWPDLAPSTKAYKKSRTGRRKHPLALLSAKQRKQWWKYYSQQKAIGYKKGLPEKQIKSLAAAYAWKKIKAEGGKTLIDEYKDKDFLILYEKGRLIASLSPGSFNGTQYRARNQNQIFTITKTGLKLGTRVKYAIDHHEPKKPGFPRRRLWPENMKPWLEKAMKAGVLAATRRLAAKLA